MFSLGKLLVASGAVLLTLGLLVLLGERVPGFRLGRLPGDIRIEKENFTFYFPWVSCLVLGLVLNLLLRLWKGFHR